MALKTVRNFPVELVQFNEQTIQEVKDKVAALHLNEGGANGLARSVETQQKNKLMGFLAEKAVYDFLRSKLGTIVYQREKQDLSNQVDIFCGTKTVEVRSSQVKGGIETALFAKRNNGDSVYHLVGNYTTAYKKKEIIKDYYIWVIFEESMDYCFIAGGAIKDAVANVPLLTMVPKGKECSNPTQYRALRPDQMTDIYTLTETMRPSQNETLSLAKQNKEDEFYTRYQTIEKEVNHYVNYFRDKVIYCPCDNPDTSNFWKFFVRNFKILGLKKIWCSHLSEEQAVAVNYDGRTFVRQLLQGDGGFQTEECIKILRQSDVVVTNPPFSLFRDFVSILVQNNKDFLIIGNQNAATAKEIFPLFKANRVRYGYNLGSEQFQIPAWYETRSDNIKTDTEGNRYLTVEGIRWFTTLPVKREVKPQVLQPYNPFKYPQYDNFEAIEVSFCKEIPKYWGYIGVPISYLNIHDNSVFQLVGTSSDFAKPVIVEGKVKNNPGRFYLRGKRLYERIVIKMRDYQENMFPILNASPA